MVVETKGLCSVVGIWGGTSLMGAVVLSPFPVNPVLFKLRYDGHMTWYQLQVYYIIICICT